MSIISPCILNPSVIDISFLIWLKHYSLFPQIALVLLTQSSIRRDAGHLFSHGKYVIFLP